jgi:hypothetical protein
MGMRLAKDSYGFCKQIQLPYLMVSVIIRNQASGQTIGSTEKVLHQLGSHNLLLVVNETEINKYFREDFAAKEPHVDRAPLITAAYFTPNSTSSCFPHATFSSRATVNGKGLSNSLALDEIAGAFITCKMESQLHLLST